MTTIGIAIAQAAAYLAEAGITDPRREARLLAGLALNKSLTQIFNQVDEPLSLADWGKLDEFVKRRAKGEPFAYISGEREFWSLPFHVTADTLIPRPDSEAIIELATDSLCDRRPERVLDIGTGSGCLLVALLSEFCAALGVGIDISAPALTVAKQNAERNGVGDRAKFIISSWLENVGDRFDLVVSNPPYIPTADIDALSKDVKEHEPMSALNGGDSGLNAYDHIFNQIDRVLKPHGCVIVEIGIGQRESVIEIAETAGFYEQSVKCDVAGLPRALMFGKKSVGNLGGSG